MASKRALLALIGSIRCTRTLLPTDYTLVHITSPLDYQHTIVLRVEGVNVNKIVAIILAYLRGAELVAKVCKDPMPDEDELTARLVAYVMEGCHHLNNDCRIWLGTAANCVYTAQSGVTVHSTYPDDNKSFPQPQLSLYEKGRHITTQYANDLIHKVTPKE